MVQATILKTAKDKRAPKKGEITQVNAILSIVNQFTAPQPAATIPNPIIPPTTECVVEMGIDQNVANKIQTVVAINVAMAPKSRTLGSLTASHLTIPFMMVEVT